MSLIKTPWLLGSIPDIPDTQVTVSISGPAGPDAQTFTIPGGSYYPHDSSSARSAMDTLSSIISSHTGIASCSAIVGRDKRFRFTCSESFQLTGWSDLSFRSLLGFAGEESFQKTTQIGSQPDYLWSPGRCEIPDAPLGSQGLPYFDTAVGMSGDNVVVATTNNSGRKNRFLFRRVHNERVMTATEGTGEYSRFWDVCVRRYFRWKLYRDVTEEDSGTDATAVNLFASEILGPYKLFRTGNLLEFEYKREVDRLELFNTVEIPCLLVSDYS